MSNKSISVFFTKKSFCDWRNQCIEPIGFVPTMGNLHEGHLQLIKAAFKEFNCVVISIFVNPTQFGPNDDFEKYPRTLDQDQKALSQLQTEFSDKKIILFAPSSTSEIYNKDHHFSVVPQSRVNILEGKFRPGHFEGVCTVISIFLNLVKPASMYLGKKDYQQLCILKSMVKDLHFAVSVVGVDTVRSKEGLALSSRNSYLTHDQISFALKFPNLLQATVKQLHQIWMKEQEWNILEVQTFLNKIKNESGLQWDYLELKDQNLNEIHSDSTRLVLLGVVKIGSVRLLDNFEFSTIQKESHE